VTDWDRIVSAHGPTVFATAFRILGNAADAEDVVQDVFLQAYGLRPEVTVRSWPGLLRRLAAHRALDRLRRRRPLEPLGDLPCQRDGPFDTVVGNELAERLRDALAALPAREAAVFCLRYFNDLSYGQIAEALRITTGAVAQALHKARSRLETQLLEPVPGE
jgi:RNA polymerase sigma-70 factor, ECF subfamily